MTVPFEEMIYALIFCNFTGVTAELSSTQRFLTASFLTDVPFKPERMKGVERGLAKELV